MKASISPSDIISVIALIIALGSLAWNIVRDLWLDRMQLEFSAAFGDTRYIKNSTTGLFGDVGSWPNHVVTNPELFLQIVNTGRRPIAIANVWGEYKITQPGGKKFHIAVAHIPKMLQPYEVFSAIAPADPVFIKHVQEDNIEKFWVEDTAGGKWNLSSKKGWERLRKTAAALKSP